MTAHTSKTQKPLEPITVCDILGKHALFLSIILLSTEPLNSGFASALRPDQPPFVVIYCANQGEPNCCGDRLRFNATVGNVDPSDKLRYIWSLTKGRILSGQGTSSIEIDASDAKKQPIVVTLDVEVTIQVSTRGRKRGSKGVVRTSTVACTSPDRPTKPCSWRRDGMLLK